MNKKNSAIVNRELKPLSRDDTSSYFTEYRRLDSRWTRSIYIGTILFMLIFYFIFDFSYEKYLGNHLSEENRLQRQPDAIVGEVFFTSRHKKGNRLSVATPVPYKKFKHDYTTFLRYQNSSRALNEQVTYVKFALALNLQSDVKIPSFDLVKIFAQEGGILSGKKKLKIDELGIPDIGSVFTKNENYNYLLKNISSLGNDSYSNKQLIYNALATFQSVEEEELLDDIDSSLPVEYASISRQDEKEKLPFSGDNSISLVDLKNEYFSQYGNQAGNINNFGQNNVSIKPENVFNLKVSTSQKAENINLESVSEIIDGYVDLDDMLLANNIIKQEVNLLYRQFIKFFPRAYSISPLTVELIRVKDMFSLPDKNKNKKKSLSEQKFLSVLLSIYHGNKFIGALITTRKGEFEPIYDSNNLIRARSEVKDEGYKKINLYQSLHETFYRERMEEKTLKQIFKIFANDFDYQAKVSPDDWIEIIYRDKIQIKEFQGLVPSILSVTLSFGGVKKSYFSYQLKYEDGNIFEYFDDKGRSAKKSLLRVPVAGGVFRSKYGMRFHPILKRYLMHKGVDWAARRGTPIYAAGDGYIVDKGRSSTFGKVIKIKHENNYLTIYAHLHKFAQGIREGIWVPQGQLIGYVGSTGRSTGPHLHYEVIYNSNYKDPMKFDIPRLYEIKGLEFDNFTKEKDRLLNQVINKNLVRLTKN